MAALGVVDFVAGAILIATRIGHRADIYVAQHPDTSRGVYVTGAYIAVGVVLLGGLLYGVGARGLSRGRRWAWVLLLVLSLFGLTGLVRSHGVVAVLLSLPVIVLVGLLLSPSVRGYVRPARADLVTATDPPVR
jgi:hypothetical protein